MVLHPLEVSITEQNDSEVATPEDYEDNGQIKNIGMRKLRNYRQNGHGRVLPSVGNFNWYNFLKL